MRLSRVVCLAIVVATCATLSVACRRSPARTPGAPSDVAVAASPPVPYRRPARPPPLPPLPSARAMPSASPVEPLVNGAAPTL
jgi:hypothetical protein